MHTEKHEMQHQNTIGHSHSQMLALQTAHWSTGPLPMDL